MTRLLSVSAGAALIICTILGGCADPRPILSGEPDPLVARGMLMTVNAIDDRNLARAGQPDSVGGHPIIEDAATPQPEDDPVIAKVTAAMTLGRYMVDDVVDGRPCVEVTSDSDIGQSPIVSPYLKAISDSGAGGQGMRVIACTYRYHLTDPSGPWRTGFAVLLDLPKSVLARWMVRACRSANIVDVAGCAATLSSRMLNSNGGQYPITGFVAEGVYDHGAATECMQRGKPVMMNGLIMFRYGVTVQLDEKAAGTQPIFYCTTDPLPLDIQQRLILSAPVKGTFSVGRVADIRKECWPGLSVDTVPPGTSPSPWQSVVQNSMLKAIRTGQDDLFNFAAGLLAKSPKKLVGCG